MRPLLFVLLGLVLVLGGATGSPSTARTAVGVAPHLGATTATGLGAPARVVRLPLADGTTVEVHREPFRIAVVGRDGHEQVGTVPALEGLPVRVPGVDGPFPVEPLGALGGYPAMGFVVGVASGATWPLPLFTGNRVFGAEAGAVVSLVEV